MITMKNLSKRYGDKLAVDDLTFSVAPGEVLGFLGRQWRRQIDHHAHDCGFRFALTAGQVVGLRA